jgi:probable phosphoglycerate mutase
MTSTPDHRHNVWLIRHGESTWNVNGLIQGHDDAATLTARGRRQAELAAEELRGMPIQALYASDLRRARQSAEIVGRALGLPVHHDAALRERCFGALEGLPQHSLDPAVIGLWGNRIVDVNARPEGGESLHDVYQRVGAFVDRIARQRHPGDVVIVAHGGSIRALHAYFAGIPFQDAPWDAIPNGSVSCVPPSVHLLPTSY